MSVVSFADVVHQTVTFSRERESQALILELIDTPWFQRLRDISQTANTRLVYMFSEHSRFGHSVGAAYLAEVLLEKLSSSYPNEVKRYRNAVAAAAILHDIGHLAPGSHTAYKTWFPKGKDAHEELAVRIVREDESLRALLERHGRGLPEAVAKILCESDDIPPWTWEIISGGGWNVDRGNWCIVDSILAGVSYGEYNIPALTESIIITPDGHLGLLENRLDAMMHFAVSRHAMYRQLYQHRVLLAADMLNRAVAQRARDLGDSIPFADDDMRAVLCASSASELALATVFAMRESWWRYHLLRWSTGSDEILADLASRLMNRRLLKTVRVIDPGSRKALLAEAEAAVKKAGFDPRYYLHEVSTMDMHAGDYRQSMQVVLDDGSTKQLTDADPLLNTLLRESRQSKKVWLAMPEEAKAKLGRAR